MKRTIVLSALALGVLLLALPAFSSTTARKEAKKPRGTIKIESWLQANPAPTLLSGTVKACFKLTGVLVDQGGKPTWSNSNYATVPSDPPNLVGKCGNWTPVGGFSMVPPTNSESPSTLYAVHTITAKKGQIYITFAGVYNLTGGTVAGMAAMAGHGTWVITGGSGYYLGLQGEGTWDADASNIGIGYIRHTETGKVHFG